MLCPTSFTCSTFRRSATNVIILYQDHLQNPDRFYVQRGGCLPPFAVPGREREGTEAHSKSRRKRGLKRASLSFMVAATKACTAWASTRPISCMAADCCCRHSKACMSSSKMAAECSAAAAGGIASVAVCSIAKSATADASLSCGHIPEAIDTSNNDIKPHVTLPMYLSYCLMI